MELASRTLPIRKSSEARKRTYKKKASPFLVKLRDILQNPAHTNIMRWATEDEEGSFVLLDELRLEREVLPLYFKRGSINNFIRQLHLHGFKRLDLGTRRGVGTRRIYSNSLFKLDQPELSVLIQRKDVNFDEDTTIEKQKESLLLKIHSLEERLKSLRSDPLLLQTDLLVQPALWEYRNEITYVLRCQGFCGGQEKLDRSPLSPSVLHARELAQSVIHSLHSLTPGQSPPPPFSPTPINLSLHGYQRIHIPPLNNMSIDNLHGEGEEGFGLTGDPHRTDSFYAPEFELPGQ